MKSASTPEQLSQTRKPSKLQLQVPEHAGGPVRLATPPRVLINGESDRAANSHSQPYPAERRSSADFFGTLDAGSEADGSGAGADDDDDDDNESGGANGDGGSVDWKRRAMVLKRRLIEKEDELRALKRRVLEAVM